MASPRSWQPAPAALSRRVYFPIRLLNRLLVISLALALFLPLALPAPAARAQTRTQIYVDKDAPGPAYDGASWATAYRTLQAALDVTDANGATDYEVWVAEGTYYPDEGGSHVADSRGESFRISRDNVQIYGGFAATETQRDERDWVAHPTVLSGDIDGNGVLTNNAYHVLWLDGVTNEQITTATVVDGFTVTGGNANSGSPYDRGGGLYCDGSGSGHLCSPTLANLTVSGNAASGNGGGVFNNGIGGESSPTLTNVTISGNSAAHGGGIYNAGYYSGVSSPTLTNVLVIGNKVNYNGGGIYNNGADSGVNKPVFINVTVSGNRAGTGGGMFNHGQNGESSTTILNSIVWGNADSTGAQIYNSSASISATYSDMGDGQTGAGNINADPLFAAPIAAGSAPTTTGDYRLLLSSPAIDTGTNGGCPAADLDGRLRPIDGDGDGSAVCDMGAYETPQMPGLHLSKQVTPPSATPGATVTYTLVLSNAGTLDDPSVRLTDTLPAEVIFSGWVQNPGALETGGEITWQGSLARAAVLTFTFTAEYLGSNGAVANTAQAADAERTVSATATFRPPSVVLYVDKDAPGPTHDGASWATAYTTLQAALDLTNANGATGYEVWVAEGTYYPDEGGSHVADSSGESFFILYDNVQLYGGFAGTETQRGERDWTAHPTILSGDIDGDGTPTDNSYHVLWLDGVTNEQITAATVVDGFTITGGNANNYSGHDSGGGLYCAGDRGHLCSPTLANLIIRDNAAVSYGGGVYNDAWPNGESSPTLTNVTISGNAAGSGGGMYNDGFEGGESSPTLTNVTFSDNVATYHGGGLYNDGGFGGESSPTLTKLTISGNSADSGGGIYNNGEDGGESSPHLFDVTISSNNAGYNGGGMYNHGDDSGASNPQLINVTISGNSASNGGGMYNSGEDGGASSPVLLNVLISGNYAGNGGGMYNEGFDGNSSPTLTNVTISGNRANYACGGMCSDGDSGVSSPVLLNSIVWGNTASSVPEIFNDTATPDISYSSVRGGYPGTGNLDADPLFVAPVDASSAPTTTGDYRLRFDSPVIDAGTNTGAPAADIRGLPRPVNLITDMGAYEAQEFSLAITGGDAQTAAVGAAFAQPLTVQVSSAAAEPVGPGIVITFTPPAGGPGLNVNAPFTLTTDAGGIVTATVTANTLAGSYGVAVAAGGVITPAAFNLTNAPLSLTAAVAGSGSGAVTSTPAGIDCGAACTAIFDYATSVTLAANAAAGSTFGGWSGACSGTGLCTVTMTETEAVTATFTLNQYTVAASADPAAGGTVSGGGTVSHGDTVTVAAAANTGYTFVNWTEGGKEVTTDTSFSFTAEDSRTLVAHFSLNQYTVAVSADPSAGGAVSGGGAVSHGDTVTVIAAANTGYTFANWTEGGQQVSAEATYSFTATSSRALVAHFTLNQYTVAVSADPSAGGTVSGGGAVSHGDTVTVIAAANTGYTFANWTEDGKQVSTDAAYSFTAAGSRALVAHFQQLLQPLAHNDAAGVLEGEAVDVSVIVNDEDPAGGGLTVIGVTQPAHGAASINADAASVRYTPAGNYNGDDSFTYTVQDANGLTSTGTVAIVIAPLAQAERGPQLAVLDPSVHNSAAFTGSLATVQADLPAGFYTGTLGATDIFFLAYTPVVTPTVHTLTPPGTLRFGSFEFYLTAYVNERPQNGVRLVQPITLTIRYNPAILLGLDPATLQLYTWGGDAWSTEGITLVSHDIPNGTLTIAVSHLSEFAFFAAAAPSALDPAPEPNDSTSHLYLPALSK